jgi:hypothetical protein
VLAAEARRSVAHRLATHCTEAKELRAKITRIHPHYDSWPTSAKRQRRKTRLAQTTLMIYIIPPGLRTRSLYQENMRTGQAFRGAKLLIESSRSIQALWRDNDT